MSSTIATSAPPAHVFDPPRSGGGNGVAAGEPGQPAAGTAPQQAPPRPGRPWWRAAWPGHPWIWLSVFAIACGWDRAVWLVVSRFTEPNIAVVEDLGARTAIASLFSWHPVDALAAAMWFGYHAVKLFGSVWVAAAVAAVLVVRPVFQPRIAPVRDGLRRGVLLFLCAASAGLLAEGLKLVFRRQRPEFADGFFSFRFADWWSTSGLGLPSSHAAVAVATGVALSVIFPRRRVIWAALAGACVASRILAGAHFLSDALLGVLVGLAAARAIVALDLRNNNGQPVPASA